MGKQRSLRPLGGEAPKFDTWCVGRQAACVGTGGNSVNVPGSPARTADLGRSDAVLEFRLRRDRQHLDADWRNAGGGKLASPHAIGKRERAFAPWQEDGVPPIRPVHQVAISGPYIRHLTSRGRRRVPIAGAAGLHGHAHQPTVGPRLNLHGHVAAQLRTRRMTPLGQGICDPFSRPENILRRVTPGEAPRQGRTRQGCDEQATRHYGAPVTSPVAHKPTGGHEAGTGDRLLACAANKVTHPNDPTTIAKT